MISQQLSSPFGQKTTQNLKKTWKMNLMEKKRDHACGVLIFLCSISSSCPSSSCGVSFGPDHWNRCHCHLRLEGRQAANLEDERNAGPRSHHLHLRLEHFVEVQSVSSCLGIQFGVGGRMQEVLRLLHW